MDLIVLPILMTLMLFMVVIKTSDQKDLDRIALFFDRIMASFVGNLSKLKSGYTNDSTQSLESEAMAELDSELDLSSDEHEKALAAFDAELKAAEAIDTDTEELQNPGDVRKKYINAWTRALAVKTYQGKVVWQKIDSLGRYLDRFKYGYKFAGEFPRTVYKATVWAGGEEFEVVHFAYYKTSSKWCYKLYVKGAGMDVFEMMERYNDNLKDLQNNLYEMVKASAIGGVVPSKMLEVTEELEQV